MIEPLSDTSIPAGAAGANADAIEPGPSPQTGMSVSLSLSQIMRGIKGPSARAANQLLGRSGPFWMDESYDRIVRNEKEYRHFLDYIQSNPIKANLAPHQYWVHLPSSE